MATESRTVSALYTSSGVIQIAFHHIGIPGWLKAQAQASLESLIGMFACFSCF